ncbi:MAG TPA: FAD-dependent oxidoreductase [Xanthobacteraceae bacterium]|nr:FAD-dependent oxidoreductase [Xanthobacteraceae bacterium]
MDLTERHDLRSGATPWDDGVPEFAPSDKLPGRPVDVAICGAGITGAMLAERLSAAGLAVAVVDRRRPGQGSTSASTALILWEADVPFTHLARKLGEQEAARRWRRVHRAATGLWRREDIASDRKARPSLYLDGDLLDGNGLRAEAELRARHGLPSVFLQPEATAGRFGIAPRAAIVSTDSFAANPLRLTLALLAIARQRGATVTYPADALRLTHNADNIALISDQGEIQARHAILASGYERPRLFLPAAFSLKSTYVMATAPGTAPLWRENAMIWHAAHTYLYARMDPEGRVIAGGGDEKFDRARQRDALISEKAEALAANLAALAGAPVEPCERWAAVFGASPDGLPAIGRAANSDRVWLAHGFGGNGITFAALAAELLTAELTGSPDPDLACFDPYRFEDVSI